MPPKHNENAEKVTISLPRDLLAKIDDMAAEAHMSRSGLMADLLKHGMHQASVTKRLLGNKYVLRAFQLIFNITPEDCDKEKVIRRCDDAATEAVRRSILKQVKELSLAEAEAEIDRDMGLEKSRASF